ncbi:MAG: hypothetical protein CO132_04020 [Candidatus Kerfeldbacteria bacterium CG_4_9_14_3_um_filter_45_8]|nr:MAG: hypothetical protein CO132_04020 [Candidatus Kerfeldbacteria bacterium CG_4_9_14_3_um_filter_45_8]
MRVGAAGIVAAEAAPALKREKTIVLNTQSTVLFIASLPSLLKDTHLRINCAHDGGFYCDESLKK